MNNKKDVSKKSADVIPLSATGGLFSFDNFDDFFGSFLIRRWPGLLDCNAPMETFEKSPTKTDH